MTDENRPEGQEESAPAEVENLLSYGDLFQLEWALEDKIADWEWRDDGFDDMIGKARATLGRVREMMRRDESDDRKGGRT